MRRPTLAEQEAAQRAKAEAERARADAETARAQADAARRDAEAQAEQARQTARRSPSARRRELRDQLRQQLNVDPRDARDRARTDRQPVGRAVRHRAARPEAGCAREAGARVGHSRRRIPACSSRSRAIPTASAPTNTTSACPSVEPSRCAPIWSRRRIAPAIRHDQRSRRARSRLRPTTPRADGSRTAASS